MYELLTVAEAERVELLFQIVFHGFDIVVCHSLYIFHLLSFCRGEHFRGVDVSERFFLL